MRLPTATDDAGGEGLLRNRGVWGYEIPLLPMEYTCRSGGAVSSPEYHWHEKDEWLTPGHIVEAARAAMGRIDLDPCSNSSTRPNVPAARHFTREDDGLSLEWSGAVFQNHPYSKADAWVKKALREITEGRADQVIILDAARPDTRRFHLLAGFPVGFVCGRIAFIDGATAATATRPTIPSAIFYLKNDMAAVDYSRFRAAFAPFCSVYRGADL